MFFNFLSLTYFLYINNIVLEIIRSIFGLLVLNRKKLKKNGPVEMYKYLFIVGNSKFFQKFSYFICIILAFILKQHQYWLVDYQVIFGIQQIHYHQ
jgi:hypothetical protein